jgi:hypothetical protein
MFVSNVIQFYNKAWHTLVPKTTMTHNVLNMQVINLFTYSSNYSSMKNILLKLDYSLETLFSFVQDPPMNCQEPKTF